jgi:catechol-2,3-dioxygenase
MTPSLRQIDHIHVFVSDRKAAEAWYENVLGLKRVPGLEFWAADGGPLTLANDVDSVHVALFERPRENCRSTVALSTSAAEFLAWQTHLAAILDASARLEDHGISWSLYFCDPDGNPYEITCYEYPSLSLQLKRVNGQRS